ncbi:hypothetical protein FF011L_06310 [Roseimaritima multifibrata]|uniref:Uncharacterized protein n=1 Tax=Roseimaritima multifibrata TaxID=1930274 RepID=A0A517MAI1_9BACT|nr:hypothetical protein [Roseimaritima multifibrata]QDS91895.1 hypothetical protein FF011L_06310 [Roseimaritima multifibrata]
MDDRITYIIHLRPEQGADHKKTLRGLRRWLKAALRGYHLTCINIETTPKTEPSSDAQPRTRTQRSGGDN